MPELSPSLCPQVLDSVTKHQHLHSIYAEKHYRNKPKAMCLVCSNSSDAANSDLLWIKQQEGQTAVDCSIFSFFENIQCGGKGLEVSRKTWEGWISLVCSVVSWVLCIKLVSVLHEAEVKSH